MTWNDTSRPLFARMWMAAGPRLDREGFVEWRRRLLEGLSGHVLEIGAGHGLNFRHYPADVSEVVAIEPERRLRRMAQAASAAAPCPITVRAGSAEDIPCDDAGVDTVVCSLVLCSVRDQQKALREIHRVLKPGGELRFLEHVRARNRAGARVQRALDATVWPLLVGGCHTSRATAETIASSGFAVDRLEAFRFPRTQVPLPTSPHVLGIAHRLS